MKKLRNELRNELRNSLRNKLRIFITEKRYLKETFAIFLILLLITLKKTFQHSAECWNVIYYLLSFYSILQKMRYASDISKMLKIIMIKRKRKLTRVDLAGL